MGDKDRRRHSRCSFCGKDQSQVRKLVAGPGVYICDQCIALCNEVLQEDSANSGYRPSPPVQSPVMQRHGLLGWLQDKLGLKSKGWQTFGNR